MITPRNMDVAERLSDLAMKVILFFFVLAGVGVMTYFFMYCVMNNKGTQAQAISAYGDLVFFTSFGTLVYTFFFRKKPSV